MNDAQDQWQRREGYGGPESFPEDGLAEFGLGPTACLAGRELTVSLADGDVLRYVFHDHAQLELAHTGGTPALSTSSVRYHATEVAPGVVFVRHGHVGQERITTCAIFDLERTQAVIITGEVPARGEPDFRIRRQHRGGYLGEAMGRGQIQAPPFPPDLVGKRFVAEYSHRYAWELVYLNDHRVAWHGIKGNPGIGDVEVYGASQFRSDLYVVSWSEEAETLAGVFVYDMTNRRITGHMWGYAPAADKLLHAPMGGRIVESAKFGIHPTGPGGDAGAVKSINKDIVLRQHYEVWNRAHYALIEEIYTEDFACHFVDGLETRGRAGVRAFIEGHRESFPDWTEEVLDTVADGDRVVTRYRSTGTHEGAFQGIPATGRRVEINEVSIYRLENGRIAEQWGFPDGVALMKQLTG